MPAQNIGRCPGETRENPAPLSRIHGSTGEVGVMEGAEWDGHGWRRQRAGSAQPRLWWRACPQEGLCALQKGDSRWQGTRSKPLLSKPLTATPGGKAHVAKPPCPPWTLPALLPLRAWLGLVDSPWQSPWWDARITNPPAGSVPPVSRITDKIL